MDEPSAPALGVIYHAIGGLAAASFYIPYRQVRGWPWESAWLLGGVFSWIFAPIVAAAILAPESFEVIHNAPLRPLILTWLAGFLWGVGGAAFGLTIRYLGVALGYAIALGMCAFFGTILPPLFAGELADVASTRPGQLTLGGLIVCLAGIAMSGKAGLSKEQELDEAEKAASTVEFRFGRGLLFAIVAGVMSASMALGFAAGKPIAELATQAGVAPLWQNLPALIVVLFGGFCLNFLWCGYLILRRRSLALYLRTTEPTSQDAAASSGATPIGNFGWCVLAGVTWYLQFFFYGMGTTKMGAFEFSSWTLHMASIVLFGTAWGFALREWRGTSRATHLWIAAGLTLLLLSTVIVGWGAAMAASPIAH